MRPFLSSMTTHRALVAVLALPMFLGSLIVWSLADRADNVEQVPAAVVNLDEPVIKKGQQPIAAGRLLAAGLTQPQDDRQRSLGWALTSPADARTGLRDGDYYAVLTIPQGFSRQIATSLRGKDPDQAQITVRSNATSSDLVAQVSDQVAQVSADRLGEEVTTRYLGGLYKATGKLGTKLGKAADGASRLAGGTSELSDGAVQLADGIGRLGDGADELVEGQEKLARGAEQLSGGQARLAQGAQRVSEGLGVLSRRTDPLPRQTDRLADGAAQLSDGVVPYTRLLRGWAEACASPVVAAGAPRLCVATERAVGVDDRNAERLAAGSRELADGTRKLANGTPRLESGIDRLAAGSRKVADGADELKAGSRRLTGGAERLARGGTKLADGADRAAEGAQRLASGSRRLGNGSQELAGGLERGADTVPTYGDEQRRRLADVIAAPVSADSDRLGETPEGATQLAPGAIAVALWLGAFVTYLLRPALPPGLLARPRTAGAVALAGLRPGLVIGVAQVVLLYGALLLLGVELGSPVATFLMMVLTAGVFVAVNQALVALLGRRRGWLVSIGFAGVQIVSLGGVVPVDTAPAPLQVLNTLLPMPQSADGLTATILDGPVSLAASVLVLLLWGGVAVAAAVAAARRAQQMDVRDLDATRQVSTV